MQLTTAAARTQGAALAGTRLRASNARAAAARSPVAVQASFWKQSKQVRCTCRCLRRGMVS